MRTTPVNAEVIAQSVWAVPPLARNQDAQLCRDENVRIMRHIEGGGISTLLYGGNAIFYHLTMREYRSALELISEAAGEETLVIPSVGPAYGTMMDQVGILKEFDFPTVMLLPQRDVVSSAGVATAVRKVVEQFGKPVVLYLKYDGVVSTADITSLVNDGLISAIKYAVVRENYQDDDYLRGIVDKVDPRNVLSGLGDQPAIVHMRDFQLGGFTTGCGCVFPQLSASLLTAIQSENWDEAESIRQRFLPLENLRDNFGPISVLHRAVQLASIAETGPIIPLLSEPGDELRQQIEGAIAKIQLAGE
ncbi:dihydrodipicolinate synthase family protein [Calycomorphotria hydatis]|uniref:5-dehydro-4-deoxyglucarate dehydratase n=1 Tax=Calycomorphotria hydatis TaxID=2528027 RepID=A0A517TEI6_9PLAN|nr:dihydrodipicolinate synthase family protein [Calycomorphotria hydatis]QDT66791.1 5-dehydro-4-deoxyglucarate dehydratase [Calycomorphotria hydatis]